jgi:hypothetical protein
VARTSGHRHERGKLVRILTFFRHTGPDVSLPHLLCVKFPRRRARVTRDTRRDATNLGSIQACANQEEG